MKLHAALWSLPLALAFGCEDPPAADDAPSLEAALFDQLECIGLARPSTLQHLRDALHHPDPDRLRALLLAPQELAAVVAVAGPQAEAAVVVVRNLLHLLDSGAAADLLENGWDGVQCGEPVSVECTAGRGAVAVDCDDDDVAVGIRIELEACMLRGKSLDGAVTVARDGADARVQLDALTLDETRALGGELLLLARVDDGLRDRFSFAVRQPTALRLQDNGGPDGGRSCGEELRLQDVDVSVADDVVAVAFAGQHEDRERTVGLRTIGDELSFDGDCGCPRPGAGLQVEVPRPLGHDDATATATVRWVESQQPGFCAAAEVELSDWPSTCADVNNLGGDCARTATATSLSALLSAFCVER